MSEPLRGPITQYHPHQCPHCRFYTHPMLCKAFGTQGTFGEMLASLEDESPENCPRFLLDYDRLGTPEEPPAEELTPEQVMAQQDPSFLPSGKTKDCPSCGQSIPKEAQVCGYCGATFKVIIGGFCTHCRKVVLGGVEGLCPICGSALIERQYHSTLTSSLNESAGVIFQQSGQDQTGAQASSVFSGEGVQDCFIWEKSGSTLRRRLQAAFLDLILVAMIWALLVFILADGFPVHWLTFATLPALWLLYQYGFESGSGATIGKKWSNLKVVDQSGGSVRTNQVIKRLLCSLFEFGPIGIITLSSDKKHQRIGDKAARTFVIDIDHIHRITFIGASAMVDLVDGQHLLYQHILEGCLVRTMAGFNLDLRTSDENNIESISSWPLPRTKAAEITKIFNQNTGLKLKHRSTILSTILQAILIGIFSVLVLLLVTHPEVFIGLLH